MIICADIKGANVLVDTHGGCKLADFGAAKKFDQIVIARSFKGTGF